MTETDKKYSGIIFDLDGTLYCRKNLARWIIQFNMKRLHVLQASRVVRKKMMGKDLGNKPNFRKEYLWRIGKRSLHTPNLVLRWEENWFYPHFITILKEHYEPRPHLIELLKGLSQKMPLAVLSDYRWEKERLIALDIDPSFFKILAASEDFGVLKPSARPLLSIAADMGCLPESILYIGDRTDTDGAAAALVGMDYLHITDESDWDEICSILNKIISRKD